MPKQVTLSTASTDDPVVPPDFPRVERTSVYMIDGKYYGTTTKAAGVKSSTAIRAINAREKINYYEPLILVPEVGPVSLPDIIRADEMVAAGELAEPAPVVPVDPFS